MTDPPIQRARFATSDPEHSEAYIRQTYVDSHLVLHGAADAFRFSSDLLALRGVFVGATTTTIAASIEADEGIERLTIFDARARTAVGRTDQPYVLAGGDTMCIPPQIPYRSSWETLETSLVSFAAEVLDDVAAAQLGPGHVLRFDFAGAVSPVAAESWRRTSRLVRDVAAANVGRADGTLLADELAWLLAATALTSFANSTMSGSDARPDRTAPASLRRAVSYVESHVDSPLRLADLAEAARVSPRALNQTFNRHLGVSPMGYVHRVRLDRAHHELEDARPGDGQTVTAIAARWGFYDLPRFGVYYRRAYGRPPSHTLRQEPT